MGRRVLAVLSAAVLTVGFITLFLGAPPAAYAYAWEEVGTNADFGGDSPRSMLEFESVLFMGTSGWDGGGGVYTFTDTWNSVAPPGFGDAGNVEVSGLVDFGGDLYAGTRNSGGAQVWRYGGGSSWSRVSGGAFGGPGYDSVTGLAACDYGGGEHLFVSVDNPSGCGVWSYDGAVWRQLAGQDPAGTPGTGPGFGDPGNYTALLAAYGGKIYAGTGKG